MHNYYNSLEGYKNDVMTMKNLACKIAAKVKISVEDWILSESAYRQ